jgi:hypothetical protein
MSGTVGPKIVKGGLVFYMDAANPNCYISGNTTCNDLTSSISGSLENGVGYSTENNGSWGFDGTDDIILIDYSPELVSNLDNMSIEVWMNVGAIGSKFIQIITNRDTDPKTTMAINIDNRQVVRPWNLSGNDTMILYAHVGNGTNNYYAHRKDSFGITDGDNTWHQVVSTFSSSENELKLYYDGEFVNMVTTTNSLYDGSKPWRIGSGYSYPSSPYTYSMLGNISNAKMWHKTLSSAEVLQNYNALKGRFGL